VAADSGALVEAASGAWVISLMSIYILPFSSE